MNQTLISGDIGGTKTLLQLASFSHEKKSHEFTHRYNSRDYTSFNDILNNFLNKTSAANTINHPVAACFAIAGPIVAQRTKLTNLPWQVDAVDISTTFSIPNVKLINDFEAVALAVESLPPSDLVSLQAGNPQAQSMRVVLGAGTGMGVAWLTWQGNRYVPLSTEAGHMDFAPSNKLQIGLLEALQNKFAHVSVERVLSGSGLTRIFKYLQINSATPPESTPINLDEDSGAAISQLAQEHDHPIAIQSLELFAEIYGAYAGNLALAGLCRNGVYIAGGIAPKIIDTLRSGGFMRAFSDKGRFSMLMHDIPVYVITNPKASLLGAEHEAQQLAQTKLRSMPE